MTKRKTTAKRKAPARVEVTARGAGYQAHRDNLNADQCPHNGAKRDEWLTGWYEAEADRTAARHRAARKSANV